MNLSRTDIAECIEAPYEGSIPTAQEVAVRIDYLLENLKAVTLIGLPDGDASGSEMEYAVGDAMNLLELIKEKLNGDIS